MLKKNLSEDWKVKELSVMENKKIVKELQFQHDTNKMLKAALGYAERLGFAVIPLHTIINDKCTCFNGKSCTSKGKHPRISKWQEVATTDQDTIIKYWQKWPDSNIGIVTGKKNGVFVLDIDIKDNGHESLEQLTDHFGPLPDTVEQITGSGGSHYLFKYKEGIGNKTNLMPGIDIRGDGGFIVVAPSIHESGRKYEWELSSHPLEVETLDAPNWLINMVVTSNNKAMKKRPSSHWVDLFNNTSSGNRNNAAAQMAGHLFRRYVDPLLVIGIMEVWNENKVNPPLDHNELNTIIDSVATKENRRRQQRG